MSQPQPKPAAKLKLRRRAAPSAQEPLTEAPAPHSQTSGGKHNKESRTRALEPSTGGRAGEPSQLDSEDNKGASISFEQLVEMFGDDMLSLNELFHAPSSAAARSEGSHGAEDGGLA